MDMFLKTFVHSFRSFANRQEGAQVIEYALIIAVVSIALVAALQALTNTSFDEWIGRVATCLAGTSCI